MLAILTTHPIQYQVPLWQALARDGRLHFEVWYLTDHGTRVSHDPEFGKDFAWDMEMLSGYPYRFLEAEESAAPGAFWKCRLRERLRYRLHASGARALWILGWQVAAYWQAVFEAKRAGVEVWLRGESNDLAPVPLWKHYVKRLVHGQLFRRIDRFLYIGPGNRRLYRKYGVPDNRLYPAPYAVDNERFAQQADALRGHRRQIRQHWKIPDDGLCVLFCGKFISKKRPSDLIRAANSLIRDGRLSNVHLLFVGSGELGVQLRTACDVLYDAENKGVTSSPARNFRIPPATFAGFLNQTEISKAYVAADCLALPSDSGETWGLVLNEALASGLPCVASRDCGSTEALLSQLGPRFSFDCEDIDGIANALVAVASSHAPPGEIRLQVAHNTFSSTVNTVYDLYRLVS